MYIVLRVDVSYLPLCGVQFYPYNLGFLRSLRERCFKADRMLSFRETGFFHLHPVKIGNLLLKFRRFHLVSIIVSTHFRLRFPWERKKTAARRQFDAGYHNKGPSTSKITSKIAHVSRAEPSGIERLGRRMMVGSIEAKARFRRLSKG